ncbi:MAG TPA: flagellar basal body rod C-terminal domain-containing protein [Opitutaceae bacterium]|nr:flagellar basal body rod C-terminal domain-containing protein [Opitutaceae bacterium]
MISALTSSSLPDPVATAQAGMRRGQSLYSTAAEALAQGNLDPGNVVGLLQGQRTYEMNAQVVRAAEDTLGTQLDTRV